MGTAGRGHPLIRATVIITIINAILVAIVNIGSHWEQEKVRAASSTQWIYDTNKVCAVSKQGSLGKNETDNEESGKDPSLSNVSHSQHNFSTYDHIHHAHANGAAVAHCGQCGHCSSLHDISVMNATKNTLTRDATACAFKGLFFGREAAIQCMHRTFQATKPCLQCWTDNVMCTTGRCTFSCIKSYFLNKQASHHVDNEKDSGEGEGAKKLNPCLECDEKLCGPAFIQCAGANRRRAGIISDIDRDQNREVCDKIDREWWVEKQ